MSTLVLLRDGQCQWNLENRFVGWCDIDITQKGADDAIQCGRTLRGARILPDVVHTSLQTRAIKTANLALREMARLWIPVRRHWRLNERHYGGLTGLNNDEAADRYGNEQLHLFHRSYDTPPPEMPADHPDNPNTDHRYATLPPDVLPTAECLGDVVDRILPYWFEAIVPDLRIHDTVLIASHGHSLKALVKHLSNIDDHEITNLNILSGVPLIYDIDAHGRPTTDTPVEDRYLR